MAINSLLRGQPQGVKVLKSRRPEPTSNKLHQRICKHRNAGAGSMYVDQFSQVIRILQVTGRIREILAQDGKIQPTARCLEKVARAHANESDEEKYRLAQAETLLELAAKYRIELEGDMRSCAVQWTRT
jgi:hypothetical protein